MRRWIPQHPNPKSNELPNRASHQPIDLIDSNGMLNCTCTYDNSSLQACPGMIVDKCVNSNCLTSEPTSTLPYLTYYVLTTPCIPQLPFRWSTRDWNQVGTFLLGLTYPVYLLVVGRDLYYLNLVDTHNNQLKLPLEILTHLIIACLSAIPPSIESHSKPEDWATLSTASTPPTASSPSNSVKVFSPW